MASISQQFEAVNTRLARLETLLAFERQRLDKIEDTTAKIVDALAQIKDLFEQIPKN